MLTEKESYSMGKTFALTICLMFFLNLTLWSQGITIGSGTTFTAGSSTVTIAGNWSCSGTFTCGSSTVIFNAASGNQTITSGDTFNNLTVNKTSGDLLLSNNITVNGTLTITSGDLDLNGKTLNLGSSATLSETAGNTVKGTTGTITTTRLLNAPSAVNVAGLGAIITSSANLGSTIITRGHAAQKSGSDSGIKRYFDITPTNNSSLNATLVFCYDDSELNGITESELCLFRSTDGGTNWSSEGGTCNTTSNQIETTGIDAFSKWTAAGSSAPLPVELVSFAAETNNEKVMLSWTTATEVNNYGFEVERKNPPLNPLQGGDFEKIGFVQGHGNSNSPKQYTFTDYLRQNQSNNLKYRTSTQLSYRLKQIDTDGNFEYSEVIKVNIESPSKYELKQNYPNPFNPITIIEYNLPKDGFVTLKVYDVLGREVVTLVNEQQTPGRYKVEFNVSSARGRLASGVYIYKLTSGEFISTKKLQIIK